MNRVLLALVAFLVIGSALGQSPEPNKKTLDTLGTGALRNVFEKLSFEQRITHPGNHGFPDATFDYFFGKNVMMGKPVITQTNVCNQLWRKYYENQARIS